MSMSSNQAITFTIFGEPVAKGRPRFSLRGGFPRAYTPKKTKQAEEDIAYKIMKYKPHKPFEVPLKILIIFYKSIPKSATKETVKKMTEGEILPSVKPDIDNYIKLVMDAMNGIFFKDDNLVCEIWAKKKYSLEPKTVVRIEEIRGAE